MGDKEHLDMFTNRFATEYFKLVSMLKRLHSGEEQKAVDFIFAINARLVAAFFIEALPKHFDDLRKDMSNPKNSQVVQPDDLTEAFKLASDYNNVKGNRMTLASPPPGNSIVGISTTVDSSDPKALKLALAAIEKKQQQAAGSKPGNKSPPPPSTPPPATPRLTSPSRQNELGLRIRKTLLLSTKRGKTCSFAPRGKAHVCKLSQKDFSCWPECPNDQLQ
jgi:hypothetical protein